MVSLAKSCKNSGHSSDKVFDNIPFVDLFGNTIFYGSVEKAQWYIKKDLAKREDKIVRLLFSPKFSSLQNHKMLNKCVVCGVKKNLTRHHVIPKRYRDYLPEYIKNHNQIDLLPLCEECHKNYEKQTRIFSGQLDATILGYCPDYKKFIRGVARALQKNADKMPDDKKESLRYTIRGYLGRLPDEDDISNLADALGKKITVGELVAIKVRGNPDSLGDFVDTWRNHFLKTMRPLFLPTWIKKIRSEKRQINAQANGYQNSLETCESL